MRKVADMVTGTRAKWIVFAVWVLLLFVMVGPSA